MLYEPGAIMLKAGVGHVVLTAAGGPLTNGPGELERALAGEGVTFHQGRLNGD